MGGAINKQFRTLEEAECDSSSTSSDIEPEPGIGGIDESSNSLDSFEIGLPSFNFFWHNTNKTTPSTQQTSALLHSDFWQ